VPSRNHIHAVVRTPNGGDYGLDLLRQGNHERYDHSTGSTPPGDNTWGFRSITYTNRWRSNVRLPTLAPAQLWKIMHGCASRSRIGNASFRHVRSVRGRRWTAQITRSGADQKPTSLCSVGRAERRFAFTLRSRSVTAPRPSSSGGHGPVRLALWPPGGATASPVSVLPGGTSDVGRDDIGRVPVQAPRARSYLILVRGSACEAASCTSRNGTPASSAAVINACLSVVRADSAW